MQIFQIRHTLVDINVIDFFLQIGVIIKYKNK